MTQEEKARAYDKVSKEVKDFFEGRQKMYSDVIQTLEYLFPELKESEDEKIRKWLINTIKAVPNDSIEWEKIDKSNVIAWLEKQGEKPQGKSALEAIKEEVVDNANKVEPKFGVGDFIADYYCRGKIVKITDDSYLLDTGQGIPFSCEHNTHLWTIKDAKDGDVLGNCNIICIFREIAEEHFITTHCLYNEGDGFVIINDETIGDFELKPATKEQRDLLFAKMREAGYIWNSDEKELKESEQESLQWNISDYKTWQYIVSDVLTLHDGIGQYLDDGFCKNIAKNMQEEWSKKLSPGQNPAWSEEDEYIFGETIQHLEELIRIEKIKHFSVDVQYYQRDINWLKSIKQRLGGEK